MLPGASAAAAPTAAVGGGQPSMWCQQVCSMAWNMARCQQRRSMQRWAGPDSPGRSGGRLCAITHTTAFEAPWSADPAFGSCTGTLVSSPDGKKT